ncbi:MAG: YjbH domain-containing protein, partial [Deltaproteobacteria bacterium]|nr:YjbH domain-containing protein [Deltaproteobacteria bacterium]
GRLINIENIPTPYAFSYLDRVFDLKCQVFSESRSLPAIAVGVNDFHGTRCFPSEYLVFSRQYYPFDFTVGIGTKRMKGVATLLDKAGLFGGVELALTDVIHFMAEYNPVRYEEDVRSARGVPGGARWPVNLGIRAEILKGVNFDLSYQRGDTLGAGVHLQFQLGKQLLPQKPDPPVLLPVDRRSFRERANRDMINDIHRAIQEAGFSDICVYTDGSAVVAEFENTKYLSYQKAAGRVLRILMYHSPSDCNKLTVVEKIRDMPIMEISVSPSNLEMFLLGKIPEDIFYSGLMEIKVSDSSVDSIKPGYIGSDPVPERAYAMGIKPDLTTFWLDATDYIQLRAGIKPFLIVNPWKGASVYGRFDVPLYSSIYASAEPSTNPIRTDQADYMDLNYTFDRLLINQAFRLYEKGFGRVSLGYFDKMYAGIGGEALFFLGEGALALGVEGDWVLKREPETQFAIQNFRRYSILGNAYYYYGGLDMTLHLQYGRFLAGDTGWMFDINREFDTGAVVGLYYSYTDTDIFTDKFNRGYNNKGVYLNLPFRIFLDHDSNEMLNYGISPWTRDVAATVPHWQDIYSSVKELMPGIFRDGISGLRE